MERTVIVFGAGATKACGGPLTNEILPRAFQAGVEHQGYLSTVRKFLTANFQLTDDAKQEDYPPLPLLLSLIDTAIDRRDSFGREWPLSRLEEVRTGLEYIIFAVVTNELKYMDYSEYRETKVNHYRRFFEQFDDRSTLSVISFNYDIIADNALFELDETLPDYNCDITINIVKTQAEKTKYHVPLYKLHGSLNWLYCRACQRLELAVSDTGMTFKVLKKLYRSPESDTVERQYDSGASLCTDRMCRTPVQAVMITPTHLKDYRNPHIARIWYEAAQALRQAKHVYFIGYSLPPEDADVMYFLKRNLQHLDQAQIWVVEKDDRNPPLEHNEVGKRYRGLFGDRIRWCTCGFQKYIAAHSAGIENHRCQNSG